MSINYEKKYLKYKEKYLKFKNQTGGEMSDSEFTKLSQKALYKPDTDDVLSAVKKDSTLLNRTCESTRGDDNGWQLIHFACKDANLKLVEGLVELGADVNAKTTGGTSCLDLAVMSNLDGYKDVIKYLLEKGVNPSTDGNNWKALGYLAYHGELEMCLLFLSYGADITAKMRGDKNKGEHTALGLFGGNPLWRQTKSDWEKRIEDGRDVMVASALEYLKKRK